MNETVLLPVVDDRLCTGCGFCVHLCPSRCLEMTRDIPVLPRPTDCISCTVCVLICPESAIQMQPKVPRLPDRNNHQIANN